MQLLVRRMPAKRCTLSFSSPRLARTRLISGARPRTAPVFPDRGKAPARPPRTETPEKLSFAPWLFKRGCGGHTCGGQFAHAPSRRRAVCNGRLVTRVAACNASAACKAVCPVCFFPASRTPAHLRWASRAPCLFLLRAAHARSWFRVRARAELLFFQAEKSPGASPTHRNARKAELCSFGFSGVSPASRRFAAEGPLKPASSQKKGEISERAQAFPFAQKRLKS